MSPNVTLPARNKESHKGDFGRVLMIGGSRGMSGAIAMSGIAALRSGSGLLKVATPDSIQDSVAGFSPCLMTVGIESKKGHFSSGAIDQLLEEAGLLGMIGKAERGPSGIEAIKKHRSVYLIAVGGAAYLVSKAIKKSRIVAFEELGMEAIHEFVVEDMPVTVAVSTDGLSLIHI